VNNTLFFKYINNIYAPYLHELQETKEFEACEAVLLKHNRSSHMLDGVSAILTHERIKIVIVARRTTHISKCLMWWYLAR
jgi:hypothetical protein